jgi:hypothetical protein
LESNGRWCDNSKFLDLFESAAAGGFWPRFAHWPQADHNEIPNTLGQGEGTLSWEAHRTSRQFDSGKLIASLEDTYSERIQFRLTIDKDGAVMMDMEKGEHFQGKAARPQPAGWWR